jgi:hypothetical protein
LTAEGTSERPQHEVPYLHVRPPRRIVGVGGEGIPLARIVGNRPGLLRLREQIEAALRAEDGMAVMDRYREVDGAEFDATVQKANRPVQMGEACEPERPDYSRMI